MKAIKKKLRQEINDLEETKDEENRGLTRLRGKKRQIQRDVEDLEVFSFSFSFVNIIF